MGFYPVSLQLSGRPCLVVGGGGVATRKVDGLLGCGAVVTVISPLLTPELERRWQADEINWRQREYRRGDLAGFFMVIAATDDEAAQEGIYAEAELGNILLNVADVPKRCNLILPAVVRRGDLTVSISTGGASPALARKLRRRLQDEFGFEYEVLLRLLAELRGLVLSRGGEHHRNRDIFHRLVEPDCAQWIREGRWDLLEEHVGKSIEGDEALACLKRIRDEYRDD